MRFRSEYRLDNPLLSQRNTGNIAVASSTLDLQQNSTDKDGDKVVESFDGNLHGHSMRFRSEYRLDNPFLSQRNTGNIAVASSTLDLQQNSTDKDGDKVVESFDGNLHGHSMRFRSEYRLDNPLFSQRSTDNIAVASSTLDLQQNSTDKDGDKVVESFDGNLHGHSMRFRSEYRLDNPLLSQRNTGNIAVACSTLCLQQNSTD